MAKTGRDSVQQMLRLPPTMRDELKVSADESGRSLNAEIVDRLERSLSAWPSVDLPIVLIKAGLAASPERRAIFAERLNVVARDLARELFHRGDRKVVDFVAAFSNLTDGFRGDAQGESEDKLVELLEWAVPLIGDEEATYSLEQLRAARELVRGVKYEIDSEGLERKDE